MIDISQDGGKGRKWTWVLQPRIGAEGGGLSGSCGGDSFPATVGLERERSRRASCVNSR